MRDEIGTYNLRMTQGELSLQGKNYRSAIINFNLAIDIASKLNIEDTTLVDAYNQRGLASMGLTLYDNAIIDFNAAIFQAKKLKLKETRIADIYNQRGLAFMKVENYKAAVEDFTIARKQNSKNNDFHKNFESASSKLIQQAKQATEKQNLNYNIFSTWISPLQLMVLLPIPVIIPLPPTSNQGNSTLNNNNSELPHLSDVLNPFSPLSLFASNTLPPIKPQPNQSNFTAKGKENESPTKKLTGKKRKRSKTERFFPNANNANNKNANESGEPPKKIRFIQ